MLNKIKHTAKTWNNKFIKAIAIVGATLLITLNVNANPSSKAVQKEIKEVLKKNPDKEIVVKMDSKKAEEKVTKFEMMPSDSIKDPYEQIKEYVNEADMDYFNQLKTHIESKDSVEQVRCKAVVYAILQDKELTQEQREILALSQFEILARMPGSDYRFSKKSSELTKTDEKYKEKTQRYYAYKTYLSNLALDEEIAKLDEKNKQLDEKNKQLDREIQLLEQLLKAYQQK